MSVVVYGIRNCDTIKKTLKWLDERGLSYRFHDYRKDGLSPELLAEFVAQLGWESLLNKRGTTYRALDAEVKNRLDDHTARELMLSQPAIIKRPLLVFNHHYLLGFDEHQYQDLLG
ncbi:MAG: ArsC family reductase [Aeromonadaceae bacterium]